MTIDCDIIENNIIIYKNVLFPSKNSFITNKDDKELIELRIEIQESDYCPGYPNSEMDESCNKIIFKSLTNFKLMKLI